VSSLTTADAVDDQASAGEGAITISVLANDSGHGLIVTDVGSTSNGTTSLAPGGLKINYTPDPFFSGIDTFTYTIRSTLDFTDSATVTVAVTQPKLVFVSSQTFSGNLGGLEGADDTCSQLASSAGFPGSYRAWLGVLGVAAPDTRFTRSTLAYRLANGTTIAQNYDDLTDGSLLAPINVTESGESIAEALVWTSVKADGTAVSSVRNCDAWTNDVNPSFPWADVGIAGYTDTLWTDEAGIDSCGASNRIYCFQQ
jgi:hypothetical protein